MKKLMTITKRMFPHPSLSLKRNQKRTHKSLPVVVKWEDLRNHRHQHHHHQHHQHQRRKNWKFLVSNFLHLITFRTTREFLATNLKSACLPLTTLPKNAYSMFLSYNAIDMMVNLDCGRCAVVHCIISNLSFIFRCKNICIVQLWL